MTCNEFEEMGLDAERDASLTEAQRAAAAFHAASCPRCAALRDSWEAKGLELRSLAQATDALGAPARVEMRLRQQFRTQYHTPKARRAAVVTAWALAATAVLAGAVSWITWQKNLTNQAAIPAQSPRPTAVPPPIAHESVTARSETPAQPSRDVPLSLRRAAAKHAGSAQLVADNGLSGFTLLPGVFPLDSDYSEILRVRMQRATLASFGLPVNEERAGEWIRVDLLVGNDGLPEAVRLSR